jgi:tetratricopeptide (TPR) repeat protein
MSGHPVSAGGRTDAADYKLELLGRLGLGTDASEQDVEAAHDGLVEFLELAPHDMKSWAAAQTGNVDEAFALLSGPEQDLVRPTAVDKMAQDTLHETRQTPAAAPAETRPPAAPAAPAATSAPAARQPRRNQLIGGALAVLLVAVVLGVYYAGRGSSVPGISGTPTTSATTAPSGSPTAVPVDQAKVAALTKKITANPKDKASLQSLGDIYFAALDYKNASVWEQKVLGVDPKNQLGLLSLGAAQFNLGNNAEAKKEWLVAAGLYPKVAEVHYDLGFLYMSQTPPDTANMTIEWNKVIAIDPKSTLAQTVQSHLGAATAKPSAK